MGYHTFSIGRGINERDAYLSLRDTTKDYESGIHGTLRAAVQTMHDSHRFASVSFEYNLFGHSWLMSHIDVGGEDDLTLAFGLPFGLGMFFLSFENVIPRNKRPKWMPRNGPITTGFRLSDGLFVIDVWNADTFSENRMKPWWKHIVIPVLRLLLGKTKYREVDLGNFNREVVLPEGTYPVKVRMYKSFWRFARVPFEHAKVVRADVEFESKQPAIPGKGENSWDLNDDAVWGMTLHAKTPTEAVEEATASILRTRKKRA